MMIRYIIEEIKNPFICTLLMLGSRSEFIGGIQNDFS